MKRAIARGVAAAAVSLGALEVLAWSRMHREEKEHAGTLLHVEESGDGAPSLLIPGLQASTRYWGDVGPLSRTGRRILLADLLGFGRSPWPMRESYSLDNHIEWLRRTMIARDATRNLTIVAHSFGTVIAAHYAARFPDEIDRLYLLGTPLFDSPEEARESIRKMSSIAALFSLNRFAAREGCMLICAFRPLMERVAPLFRPDLPPEVAQDAMLHHWPSIREAIEILLHVPVRAALAGPIGEKTVFVHGLEDSVTSMQRVHDAARSLRASVIEVAGGHHSYAAELPRLLRGAPPTSAAFS